MSEKKKNYDTPYCYSHSKLDIARTCFLKFKYKYIDKIEAEEDRSAANFGEVIHYIAEHYTGNGKEELLALYHSQVPEKIKLTDEYKKRVPVALKNIHSHWLSVLKYVKPENLKREGEVTIKLNEEISLTGKLDLIIHNENDTHTISDYKTSKNNKFANYKNQLSMYMFLLHKKYGIPYEKMDTDIIYLSMIPEDKHGNQILNEGYENISKKYNLDETDVELLLTEIETIHLHIKKNTQSGNWKAKPAKFSCTYCGYKNICKEKFN